MKDYVIIVLGHARPESLQYVLEGLRRQNALAETQVWLDGHHLYHKLRNEVEACRALEQCYPGARWYQFGSLRGLVKLFLDAFALNASSYRYFIFLEDDCFPDHSAVQSMLQTLREVEQDPRIFSVYGHHFGASDEGTETTAFQGWGWATTTEKLVPIAKELSLLWAMPELEAREWFRANLTDEIRKRMDRYPGRANSKFLTEMFSFDTVMAFLIAKQRKSNKKTERQVIYNFGVANGAGHFPNVREEFLKPPFNMITRETLIERFGLQDLPNNEELIERGTERVKASLRQES